MLVYTGGTFDLFHDGHKELLRYCRRLAGKGAVVVGLNRSDFVERYKGRPPAQDYETRAEVLRRQVRWVDVVIPNGGDEDSRPAIEAVMPALVVIGSDWHEEDYLAQLGLDFDWLHARGITLAYAPRPSGGPSTTAQRGA